MQRVFRAPSRRVQAEGVTERLAVEMAVPVVAGRSAVAALAPIRAAQIAGRTRQ